MQPVTDANDLPLDLPPYTQLLISHDPERLALWYYLNPKPRLCSTKTLATEIRDLQTRVTACLNNSQSARDNLRYLVAASATPKVFNLGGDLELFIDLINERDRDALYNYGRAAVEVLYHNWINLGIPTLTTISLVQGTALGGGFEGALSGNVLIAEEGAQMGFPEIMFNLFPGMGGYSLLVRRIEPIRAERLLHSGRQYYARELWEMGLVDELAPEGEGVHIVNDFIRRQERFANGHLAIRQVRQRVNPLTYEELLDVVEIWAGAAMRLTTRDLRLMTQITQAQDQLEVPEDEALTRPRHRTGNVQTLVSAS